MWLNKRKINMNSIKEKRKVTFAINPIIIIFDDWEDRINTFDLDKKHFRLRIQRIEKEISWCFTSLHHEKIYSKINLEKDH